MRIKDVTILLISLVVLTTFPMFTAEVNAEEQEEQGEQTVTEKQSTEETNPIEEKNSEENPEPSNENVEGNTSEEITKDEIDDVPEQEEVSEEEITTDDSTETTEEEKIEEIEEVEEEEEASSIHALTKSATVFPLKKGERHAKVIELKKMLNRTKFDGIKETNFYGNFTMKQVKKFQKFIGLPVTGKVDETTFVKLQEFVDNPFQEGVRHPDTILLKKNLNKLGFGKIKVTNLYGSFTAKKVKEFQKYYGLKVTGQADLATLEKITELMTNSFQKGNRHKDIIQLKKDLNRLGFGKIKVTTLYGSFTEKRVKDFQRYYGLEVTGIADKKTLNKIDEIISSPYQKGKRHQDIPQLKRNLNAIGFGNIKVTTYFGKFTEKRVKDFQKHHGLVANGIIDPPTLAKLQKIETNPFRKGRRHQDVIQLKRDLNRLGFGKIKVTTLYGSFTEKRVKDFQRYYGLEVTGIANKKTLNKIDEILSSPYQKGKRHQDMIKIKQNLNDLGYGNIKVTTYFGSFTEKKVKDFQKAHKIPVSGIIDEVTLRLINNGKVKIFLDPGHGGKDSGASAYNLREKDVVLDIALHAASFLRNNYSGVEVKLSRETDVFIPLKERASMANNWGADYFLSVHNNSHLGSAHGFESYIHNSNVSITTRQKQAQIHNYISKKLKERSSISDRGKKTANFSVLRNTQMPAILIEYLFIDHVKENAVLSSSAYREFLGRTTAEAIANAFDLPRK